MNERLAKQLEALSTSELVELQKLINQLIRGHQKQTKKTLLNEIQLLAKSQGLTVEEVIWKESGKEKKKKQYPPKYQNPLDPNQAWTGLGKQPKWVQAYLNEGKPLQDLLINN